jgi:hypothetical protein
VSGFQFNFAVHGVRSAALRVDGLAKRASAPGPAFEAIHRSFMDYESKVFAAEGAYDGAARWASLSQSRVTQKSRQKLRPEINRATDALRRSLTQGGADHVYYHAGIVLRMGTKLPYARRIHEGDAGKNLPPRPLWDISVTTKRRWKKMLSSYIARGRVTR